MRLGRVVACDVHGLSSFYDFGVPEGAMPFNVYIAPWKKEILKLIIMPNDIELAAQNKAAKRDWIEKVLTRGDERNSNYYSHDDLDRYRNYLGSMYDQFKDSDRWSEIESITNAFNPGQRTGWDSFIEGFGFGSSHRQNYINGMNEMMSSLGQISSTRREEEYNSAAQAADRMRAAGLNPDLQGVEGAGQASEFNEPERVPMADSSQQQFATFTNMCLSCVSMASGLAKDMAGLQGAVLANEGRAIENNKNIGNVAFEYIKSHTKSPHKDTEGKWVVGELDMSELNDWAKDHFHSRSTRNKVVRQIKETYDTSLGHLASYSSIKDAETAWYESLDALGRSNAYGRSDRTDMGDNDPAVIVATNLNKTGKKVRENQQKADEHASKYTSDYYQNLDGAKAADATNKSNDASIAESENRQVSAGMDKILNDSLSSIITDLANVPKGDSWYGLSKAALLIFSAMRANMFTLPSVHLPNISTKNFHGNVSNTFNK